MQQVFDLIRLAAPSKSNILILGESGTGKELVAKAIHHHSRRAQGPFVTVNSGSMPPTCSRARSSATSRAPSPAPSRPRRACSRSPTTARSSSTRSATSRSRPRRSSCGSSRRRSSCASAASTRSASTCASSPRPTPTSRALVRQGAFREDLYYRLNVITIQLPPLRDRTEDIPLLARHFLARLRGGERQGDARASRRPRCELLMDYRWPGNVRELENAIERAVVLSTGEVLDVDLLPPAVRSGAGAGASAGISPLAAGEPAERLVLGRRLVLRTPAGHPGAAVRRRRPEEGGRAAADQADDAARDDEAPGRELRSRPLAS